MKFENLIAGEFVWRDSRFTAAVRIDGEITHAHIANSGRLPGLLSPGSQVWLSYTGHPKRRTQYDLKLVDIDGELVSIDARLPNPLFEEAVKEGRLEEFNFKSIKRELFQAPQLPAERGLWCSVIPFCVWWLLWGSSF